MTRIEDSVATKHLLAGIKSIEVRSYQFASDNAYSAADIDSVRSQLAPAGVKSCRFTTVKRAKMWTCMS